MLLLGIDIGTTNWKAAIFDESGHLLAISATKTITHFDKNNWATYDPNEMWSSIATVIRQVSSKIDKPENIAAVSVTSMAESIVPLDKSGNPTFPIIAWFDRRSLSQSQFLGQKIGKERIFEITGNDNNPIFSLSKILWIRDNDPLAFHQAKKWLCVTDYIYYKLTKKFATDYTIASRTLLLDINRKTWSEELLDIAELPKDFLPPIYPSGTVIGGISREAAEQTGLKKGIAVVVGGQDHPCGLLGSGTLIGRMILDSSGTAESFIAISEKNAISPKKFSGLRYSRYLDPQFLLAWGGIMASGLSVDWAIEKLFNSDKLNYIKIIKKLEKTVPGSNGLLYFPHLRGSGAPYWDSKSRGAFIGLKDIHTREDMLRAVIEGLCFEARTILELIKNNLGYQFDAINTIGGGARNHFWQQTKADIIGMQVEVPEVEEAAAKGACLLAGIGIGVYKNMLDVSSKTYSIKNKFIPNCKNKKVYDELYKIYKQLYKKLSPINNKLYAINNFIKI